MNENSTQARSKNSPVSGQHWSCSWEADALWSSYLNARISFLSAPIRVPVVGSLSSLISRLYLMAFECWTLETRTRFDGFRAGNWTDVSLHTRSHHDKGDRRKMTNYSPWTSFVACSMRSVYVVTTSPRLFMPVASKQPKLIEWFQRF